MPTTHEMHHRSTPSAFAYSMPPQPAVSGSDTPSVSFDTNRLPQSANGTGVGHSDQAPLSHLRSSGTNQPQESEQGQQQPTVRNTFIGRTEDAELEQSQQRAAVHNTFMARVEDAEQRMPRNLSAQARRSDRSSSPRASARRSFNRYSADLSHSGTSSDVEEAAARSPPFNRTRHQRTDSRSRLLRQAYDPRIITGSQLQQLTASLPRLLRGDLPDDTSPTCDICAKDYSTVSVPPSEEEEVAVKLPCGHCFGESCITEWFDTCKKHKNKVTCPMCRKQLIEPPQSPYMTDPFGAGVFHPSAYLFARNAQSLREMMASEFPQYARAL